ncbi:MAG: PKD domain-containing protein, partial [Flavobacteriales bacterium]
VVYPKPVLNISSSDNQLCIGDDATLTAVSDIPVGYDWSLSDGSNYSEAIIEHSFNQQGVFDAEAIVTTVLGCSDTALLQISVYGIPFVDIADDTIILCDQPIIDVLTANPSGGFWSDNPNVSANGNFIPNGIGFSQVVYNYTDPATGCTGFDSLTVETVEPILADASDDFEICQATQSIPLVGSPSGGTWSGPNVQGSLFTPLISGTNSLTYAIGTGTCYNTDILDVYVKPKPVLIINDTAICYNTYGDLMVSGAETYQWSPIQYISNFSNDVVTVQPLSDITYNVYGININTGCRDTADVFVGVIPLPVITLQDTIVLCNQPIAEQLVAAPVGGVWGNNDNVEPKGLYVPEGIGYTDVDYLYTSPLTGCADIASMTIQTIPPT